MNRKIFSWILCWIIGAIIWAIVAWINYIEGKTGIASIQAFLSVSFFIKAVVNYKKNNSK